MTQEPRPRGQVVQHPVAVPHGQARPERVRRASARSRAGSGPRPPTATRASTTGTAGPGTPRRGGRGARARGRRSASWRIWVRQEKPSASTAVVRVRGAHGRHQPALGARRRHLVVALLEAEVPGEPAAALVEHLGADPERGEHGPVGVEAGSAYWWQWIWTERPPAPVASPRRAPRCARRGSRRRSASTPPAAAASASSVSRAARPRHRAAPRCTRARGRRSARRRRATASSAARLRRSTARAVPSWPVVTQVRPQHTPCRRQLDAVAEALEHGDRVEGEVGVERRR